MQHQLHQRSALLIFSEGSFVASSLSDLAVQTLDTQLQTPSYENQMVGFPATWAGFQGRRFLPGDPGGPNLIYPSLLRVVSGSQLFGVPKACFRGGGGPGDPSSCLFVLLGVYPFGGRRKRAWTAPGGRETFQKGRGLCPPIFVKGCSVARGHPDRRSPLGQKAFLFESNLSGATSWYPRNLSRSRGGGPGSLDNKNSPCFGPRRGPAGKR